MNINIAKTSDDDYLQLDNHINLKDADADLIAALNNKNDILYSIFYENQLVGISQIAKGKRSYLYIFIDPKFRNKGIGSVAVELCEKELKNGITEEIVTSHRKDDAIAYSLAKKFGYTRKFATCFMKYSGTPFELPILNIRPYRDEDYIAAHELYAVAFHEMRVRVGDFPDSKVEVPTDEMRQHWANTKNERLVYAQDEEIVGYARIVGNEIASVAIEKNHQGFGLGQNFIKYICNKILSEGNQSVDLFCVVGNKAKHLYDTLGFKAIYTADILEKRTV